MIKHSDDFFLDEIQKEMRRLHEGCLFSSYEKDGKIGWDFLFTAAEMEILVLHGN
jgi:hypothetical protein